MDRTAESQTEALAGPLQAPESVPDVGVPKNFLEDLVLKILYLAGPLWLLELAERTRLSVRVIDELFRRLGPAAERRVAAIVKEESTRLAQDDRRRTRSAA